MSAITIDIKKGEKALENLTVSIDGNSIGDLLASLKTAKNDSNAFLTTLVNQEKGMKNRKHEEIGKKSGY